MHSGNPEAPPTNSAKRLTRLQYAVQGLAFVSFGAWNFLVPDLKPNEVTRAATHQIVQTMQVRGAVAAALFFVLIAVCMLMLRSRPMETKSVVLAVLSIGAASYGLWRGWSLLTIDQRLESAFLLEPEVTLPGGWTEDPRRSPIMRTFANRTTDQTLILWTMGSGQASDWPVLGGKTCLASVVDAASGFIAGALKTPRRTLLPSEYLQLPSTGPDACEIRVAASEDRVESDFGLWPCPPTRVVHYSAVTSPRNAPLPDLSQRIVCPTR